MNETPKESTRPSSMPSAVSGESEVRCVEPIFSEQVNGMPTAGNTKDQ